MRPSALLRVAAIAGLAAPLGRPAVAQPAAAPAADAYAPLRLYDGAWRVRRADGVVDRIANHCARVGRYFACEQTVNDTVRVLLAFVPTDTAGRYVTQGVTVDGHATGRGTLAIDGARWTYGGQATENGKTTYFRTINVFTGPNRIHFEAARSDDGAHWTVTLAGDEERVGAAPAGPPAGGTPSGAPAGAPPA